MSLRWVPAGRAHCITPEKQTPVIDVYDTEHHTIVSIVPAALDTVTDAEITAATSLRDALTEFIAACEPWRADTDSDGGS